MNDEERDKVSGSKAIKIVALLYCLVATFSLMGLIIFY